MAWPRQLSWKSRSAPGIGRSWVSRGLPSKPGRQARLRQPDRKSRRSPRHRTTLAPRDPRESRAAGSLAGPGGSGETDLPGSPAPKEIPEGGGRSRWVCGKDRDIPWYRTLLVSRYQGKTGVVGVWERPGESVVPEDPGSTAPGGIRVSGWLPLGRVGWGGRRLRFGLDGRPGEGPPAP